MAYKRTRQAFEADLQKQESPYVFYGTPLPPLDERVRDDGSFVPVWKQEVTDDRGRKRLHGAFTGGFSAGYFNTVGSKEGWSPSTFVSSRQKAKDGSTEQQRKQRVEDFMDEEDLREAEEAQSLQTTDSFAGFGTAKDQMYRGSLMDIFRPSDESIGEKLLKRMGWREGQGIGPLVKREADLGEGQISKGKVHMFAPSDVPLVIFTQKTDQKGLGYGDSKGSVTSKFGPPKDNMQSPAQVADQDGSGVEDDRLPSSRVEKKVTEKKGGFGVGVLNDTGSDDDDPYSIGPKILYNKTIGSEKTSKKTKASKKRTINPTLQKKPVFLSQRPSGLQDAMRRCQDGTMPLEGFVLGDDLNGMAKLSLKSHQYKPPPVPSDWKSSMAVADAASQGYGYMSVSDVAKASTHTSRSRASVLGESQLPGKSVFDYLTPAARERLAAASGKSDLPPALGEIPEGYLPKAEASGKSLQDLVPKLDQDVALLALKRSAEPSGGWMPYAEDPEKRDRYRTFLEIRAGLRPTAQGDELPPRAPGISQDDWLQELQEFSRAAEVFQPVSGLMASRFTSAASGTATHPSDDEDSTPRPLLSQRQSKPENPAEAAAKAGMFGHLTRSTASFYPTRLLCKRFGVAMPDLSGRADPDSGESGVWAASPSHTHSQPKASSQANELATAPARHESNGTSLEESLYGDATKPNIGVVDPGRNEALEKAKPSMDLFRAVFGSDDDDDEDNEGD